MPDKSFIFCSIIFTAACRRALFFVTLKVKPEVSNADATKTVVLKNSDGSTRTVVPYVTTSEAETSVLVKDGTTVIIGGLMKDTLVNHKEKVPFLGDMPLIGKLFSSNGKTKEKTELVILLTPHIIDGDKTSKEAKKYMADWDKKAEDVKIEEPKEPEIKFSKIKKKTEPKKKWMPLLGAPNREPENAERPETVNAAESSVITRTPYEEYYFTLRQEISDIAKRDRDISGIKGEVQMQFTLDKEGFLVRGPVVLNNPDLRLVRSAVKTVKNSVPFSRFPKALKKDQADFNVVIRYE